MATARCDGVITTDVNGVPYCEDLLGAPLAWVQVEPFSVEDIDTAQAGSYFAAGFVLYATVMFAGWACRAILETIQGKK